MEFTLPAANVIVPATTDTIVAVILLLALPDIVIDCPASKPAFKKLLLESVIRSVPPPPPPSLKAIVESTKKYYGPNHDYYEGDDTHILPDGGVVYCEIQNQKYMTINCFPLFCSEYKKQGTDPNQAKGNVIERAFKNWTEYKMLTLNQMFSSYYLFCSGIDFEEGSTIRDRLTSATLKRPFNISYYEKIKGDSSASVYLNPKTWTCDEMADIMFEDSKKIIDRYIMNTSIKETGITFEKLLNSNA